MKNLILFAALCLTGFNASASIVPSSDSSDSWTLRLDGADAATVIKGLQSMKGNATQSTFAVTQFECHSGLSMGDRACTANLGDFLVGAIDGDLAVQVAKVYAQAAQIIFANPANRLNASQGDMVEASVQCQKVGSALSCVMKFSSASAGGF